MTAEIQPPPKVLVHIITKCPHCDKEETLQVNKAGLERWQKGALIQDCDLGIAEGDREKLISGTCDKCWDELMGDPDDVEPTLCVHCQQPIEVEGDEGHCLKCTEGAP